MTTNSQSVDLTSEEILNPSSSNSKKIPDFRACLACMAVSFSLATAPHWANLVKRGTLAFLADGDDILYLAIARIPYHGENAVRDPFASPADGVPSLYSWTQFVPLSKLARWLGMPPILIPLLWRTVGGLLFGGSVYFVFRRLFALTQRPVTWSLLCSLICLTDGGFIGGRMIVHDLRLAQELFTKIDRGKPDGLPQYRVVTPLLNMPFLLMAIGIMLPSVRRSWKDVAAGAACVALCIHFYFFFWTSLVVATSGLIGCLGLIQLRKKRDERLWREPIFLGMVLVGGLALGSSQIYSNAKTFADPSYKPTLERMCRGRHLQPGHPIRTQYIVNMWAWGKLAFGAFAILMLGFRGFGLLWMLTFSGFALANNAIISGLEFENYHWNIVQASAGEIMTLGILAMLLDRASPARARFTRLLWIVPGLLLLVGAIWRPAEALAAREPVQYTPVLKEFEAMESTLASLNADRTLAGPYETNIALLFTNACQLYQNPHSSHSSAIPDREVHERFALNEWLQNGTEATVEAKTKAGMFENGFSYPTLDWSHEAVLARRLALFRRVVESGGGAILNRYHPDVVLSRTGSPPPPGRWKVVAETDQWTVWGIEPN